MAWMKGRLWFISLLLFIIPRKSTSLRCGYPGSPAFGRPFPVRELYNPGESVSFVCDGQGTTLQGPLQRVCQENGTWAGPLPLCDRSLSGAEQYASSRATLSQYPAEKAIDGSRETCTYTEKRKPRWIRVDLRNPQPVTAVALTLPSNLYRSSPIQFSIYVISVKDSTTASYHKCANFNGRFTTPTVKLPCSGGPIVGRYVHVEDVRTSLDYFGLCEIEVFVQRSVYECGEAERPAHAYTVPREVGVVEYRCVHGYRLIGPSVRRCITSSGQWAGEQPLCEEILCPHLEDVPHGRIVYGRPEWSGVSGRPVLGSTANVSCDFGYVPSGTAGLLCMENGQWLGGSLSCWPVDCGLPVLSESSSAHHVLANGTTTLGNIALVYCEGERGPGREKATRLCREDGTWSALDANICGTKGMLAKLGLIEEEEASVPNGIVIGMGVVVFLLMLLMILLLVIRRKTLLRRNSTESLPSKSTGSTLANSSPTMSDPKQYENDAFYASITENNDQNTSKQSENDVCYASIATGVKDEKAPNGINTKSGTKSFLSTILFARKKNPPPVNEEKETTPSVQPVYAQIDLDGKRKSRLAKSLRERLDSNPPSDSELDLEPVRLRELPPLPPADDEDHSSGTYAALSLAPEPPPPLFRENILYSNGSDEPYYEHPNEKNLSHTETYMKENDIYFSR